MSDMLYNSAKSFDNATKYNYIFCVARIQKQFVINLSCLEGEFTHIMGLDHLKDIDILSSHNLSIKASSFQRILSQEIKFSYISKSDFFSQPFPQTYNSVTKSEYTLAERISVLQDIEKILDKAYTGKLYKWNAKSATIKMPDGKIRSTNISGDYMLAIPSERNPDEKIYLFLYRDKNFSKTKNTEQLHLFSAFADCLDLSRGQEHPYTILQETKENIKTQEKEILYTYPPYAKHLSAQSQEIQNDNIKKIEFDNQTPRNFLQNSSGEAVSVLPAPNPFKNLIERLKNIFKKQDKHVEAEAPVQTNDKTNISENKTIVNESLVPKELTALIEAREAFAAGNLPQAEYEQAVSKYMYSLHGREMWTEAAKSFRKQLEECPDNMKKYIGFELKSIELNIGKKFPHQRQQTLDEIKSAAHEQYVKLQAENKAAEKEIPTNKTER